MAGFAGPFCRALLQGLFAGLFCRALLQGSFAGLFCSRALLLLFTIRAFLKGFF